MPTVLRVSGPYEQLEQSLLKSPLKFTESGASRKRREHIEKPVNQTSTFNLTVSDADGGRVPAQIEETADFLANNIRNIKDIRAFPGVESLCLDFSWDFPPTSIGQYNRFPCSFIETCASLGIEIAISVYSA